MQGGRSTNDNIIFVPFICGIWISIAFASQFTKEPFDNIFDGASIVAESISMNQNGNAAIFNFIIFI